MGPLGRITQDFDELMDLREADVGSVTAEGLRRVSSLTRLHAGGPTRARLAIVVSSDVMYGMARMYELISDENVLRVRAFHSIADAKAWLEVSSG